MHNAAEDVPTQRGWYADPTGLPQQRWWDGEQWTEHLHDPTLNAYGIDGRSAGGPPASVFNNYIWAIALFPVLSFLAVTWSDSTPTLMGSTTDAVPLTPEQVTVILLGWGVAFGSIVLAFLDRRQLVRDGLERPFHWAWAFLSPGVYVIGRSLIVRRRGGGSLAPMWVWAGIMLVYVLTAAGKADDAVGVAAMVAAAG